MIAIVDYGVGNLFSLRSSFAAIGVEAAVTGSAEEIRAAERVVLPGVGAFRDAAKKLMDSGLFSVVKGIAAEGKPLLGICLGMQLLFERSYEDGVYEGLGLLKGEVRPIREVIPPDLKIPQIGWNTLRFTKESALFRGVSEEDAVYFVHSYAAMDAPDVSAVTEYGADLAAAAEKGNVYGCQFHPEKSGAVGLRILKNFAGLKI